MRLAAPCLLVAVTGLAGCAQTPADTARQAQAAAATQAGLNKELAGLIPHESQSCISNYRATNLRAYGQTLVYRVSDSLKYRTDTAGGCESIARGDILITVSPTGQLCQGDIGRTVQPGAQSPTGSCALGPFVRYSKP